MKITTKQERETQFKWMNDYTNEWLGHKLVLEFDSSNESLKRLKENTPKNFIEYISKTKHAQKGFDINTIPKKFIYDTNVSVEIYKQRIFEEEVNITKLENIINFTVNKINEYKPKEPETTIAWKDVRRNYDSPLEFVQKYRPTHTRSQIRKEDYPLYIALQRKELLNKIAESKTYGSDPHHRYNSLLEGLSRGQVKKLDPNYYRYLESNDLLDPIRTINKPKKKAI